MSAPPPPHPDRPNSEANHPPQPKRKRRGIRVAVCAVLGVVAVALVYGVGMSLYAVGTLSRHPGFSAFGTADTTPIPVKIGGRQYLVPENYFFAPPRRSGKEQQSLLLRALWPGMDGRTEENWAEFRVRHWGNKVQILLNTAKSKIPATRSVEIDSQVLMKNDQPLEYFGNIDIFDHYVPVGVSSMIDRDEYFARKDGRHGNHFIQCRPDGSVPSPSCSHWFPLTDLIWAKVSYGKPLFSQWREIQASVIALMQGFETTAQPDSLPTDR